MLCYLSFYCEKESVMSKKRICNHVGIELQKLCEQNGGIKQQCGDQNRNDGIQIFHFSVCTRWWMWKWRLQSDRDFIRRAAPSPPTWHGREAKSTSDFKQRWWVQTLHAVMLASNYMSCIAHIQIKNQSSIKCSRALFSLFKCIFSISNDLFFSPYRFFGPSSHNFYMHGQHESDETRQKPMDVDAGRNGEVKIVI